MAKFRQKGVHKEMAGQTGNPVNHPISPHVISGAFVQQYYHILHEQPDQMYKFYQESSILGRPDSNGTMVYVTTMRVSSHMEIYGLIHTIDVLSDVEINSWDFNATLVCLAQTAS